MKKVIATWCLCLFGLFPATLKADVAIEGQVTIMVELMNGEAFPGYSFYTEYQTYHYDRGYQPGGVVIAELLKGKPIEASGRGDVSAVFAKGPDGKIYKSEGTVGGDKCCYPSGVSYLLQQIEIDAVEGEVVKFHVKDLLEVDEDGKTTSTKKGSITGVSIGGIDILLIALPLACISALFLFWRMRKPKTV
jgi:hypothetical protein